MCYTKTKPVDSKHFLADIEGMPRYPNPQCSVHCSDFRFKVAKEQAGRKPVSSDLVAQYVNEALDLVGIPKIQNPVLNSPAVNEDGLALIDYDKIKDSFDLNDKRDLVWLKFTADGYLGVVAVSSDVNFEIPSSSSDYNERTPDGGKWEHYTSGIVIHACGKEWDTSFVHLYPLHSIPEGFNRHDVEKIIGNYLIEQGVPILDYFSHNY